MGPGSECHHSISGGEGEPKTAVPSSRDTKKQSETRTHKSRQSGPKPRPKGPKMYPKVSRTSDANNSRKHFVRECVNMQKVLYLLCFGHLQHTPRSYIFCYGVIVNTNPRPKQFCLQTTKITPKTNKIIAHVTPIWALFLHPEAASRPHPWGPWGPTLV